VKVEEIDEADDPLSHELSSSEDEEDNQSAKMKFT
jgi:hypothetical protein